jgi:hypothetical protein
MKMDEEKDMNDNSSYSSDSLKETWSIDILRPWRDNVDLMLINLLDLDPFFFPMYDPRESYFPNLGKDLRYNCRNEIFGHHLRRFIPPDSSNDEELEKLMYKPKLNGTDYIIEKILKWDIPMYGNIIELINNLAGQYRALEQGQHDENIQRQENIIMRIANLFEENEFVNINEPKTKFESENARQKFAYRLMKEVEAETLFKCGTVARSENGLITRASLGPNDGTLEVVITTLVEEWFSQRDWKRCTDLPRTARSDDEYINLTWKMMFKEEHTNEIDIENELIIEFILRIWKSGKLGNSLAYDLQEEAWNRSWLSKSSLPLLKLKYGVKRLHNVKMLAENQLKEEKDFKNLEKEIDDSRT